MITSGLRQTRITCRHKAAQAAPLGFGASDELVNDYLRHIYEVAKLCFPQHQAVWRVQAVAVLKPKHPRFGKWAVIDFHRSLALGHVLEWKIAMAVLIIVQNGMALAKRAAR